MPKRVLTITAMLAATLAIGVGWSVWSTRDAGPAIFPPAVEHGRKPADPPPVPVVADSQAPRAERAGAGGPVAEEVTDEPVARSHADDVTLGVPPAMAAGDFPPYLGVAADSSAVSRGPRGCKSPFNLLAEMADEPRDELWAPRVEQELRAMLGQHPVGFAVSVGCRATICQVTAIGEHDALLEIERQIEEKRYWSNFMENLRRSPVAAEFATSRFFGGLFPTDPPRHIVGYVFTSVGQATPSEPPDCAPFPATHQRGDTGD